MSLVAYTAIPGQKIDIKLDPEAFPFIVRIDGRDEKLFPEKYMEAGNLLARSTFTIPADLKAGDYPVILQDRKGPRQIGVVKIPAWATR